MKATFNSGIIQPHFGFGNASFYITSTARRLGLDLPYNNREREFQISFTDPGKFIHHFTPRSKYRVGYFAWESSRPMTDNWLYSLDFCDEVWTPNRLNGQWAREWGYEGPLSVFPHGVSAPYFHEPLRRRSDRLDIVNFGWPAMRKGSVNVLDWFADSEFANTDDASLTFKVYPESEEIAKKAFLSKGIENVYISATKLTNEENVKFMKRFNLHIYPSMGEGFGLMPLETMATGMPTIVMDGGWCDYGYIQKELNYKAPELAPPPFNDERFSVHHPGNIYPIDMDVVGERIMYAANNLEEVTEMAFERAPLVQQDFSWDRVVTDQFDKYKHMVDFAY